MDIRKQWLIRFAPLLLLLVAGVSAQQIDEATGLIIDDNFELVKTNCTVCHSAQNIIQQGGSRLTWLGLIRWMQETQGLWEFDADTETKILDYLETNYGVKKDENSRRPSIPAFLMPPNPYQTQATIKFVGLKDSYQAGDSLNVDLVVEKFPKYSQGRFDLWIALQLPNTPDLIFVTGTASAPNFSPEAQAFLSSLKSVDSTYSLLKDLIWPSISEGEYTFYALLVEEGVNPLQEADINRSNLAIQSISLLD